jgi:superfamily II DNA or RNA helicase
MERLSLPPKKTPSKEEEQRGREIYESQQCIELDLREEDVLARFQSKDGRVYVILDASYEPWRFHSSIKNTSLIASYRVATLYLIEELLCEYLQGDEGVGEVITSSASIADTRKKRALSADRPRLEFKMKRSTLEVSILSLSSHKAPMLDLSEDAFQQREKGMWIRFLFHAKKAGFVGTSIRRTYALHGHERIIHFYNKELSHWKSWSDIVLAEDLELLPQKAQTVTLIPKAEAVDSEHITIDWQIPGFRLQADELRALRFGKEEAIFLPHRGWLKLSAESSAKMTEWKQAVSYFPSGIVPHYMLFSSYGTVAKNVAVEGPLKEWLEEAQSTKEVTIPTLPHFLRPYQHEGVEWIGHLVSYHLHGLLADDMGLGKTLQVLAALDCFQSEQPSLVVCPASVVDVWYEEAKKFFPHLTVNIIGQPPGGQKISLQIASYMQLKIHKASLGCIDWNFVVLDEAQWIKNAQTKIFQVCLGLKAKTRLALTGTPIENRLQDLWNLFRFLMPGFLGTWKMFQERMQKPSALENLQKDLRPFILRRTKEEVLKELPVKSEIELNCPMLPVQQRLYTQNLKKAQGQYQTEWASSGDQHRFSILAQLMRLRQLACDPALVAEHSEGSWRSSGKLLRLETKLSEVFFSGKKVVIFSQFVRFLEKIELLLQECFPTIPSFKLVGSTSNRGEIVRQFQDLTGPGVILVSLRAGGVGITLTAADYVFLMDPWWNPSVERQAIDRVHRWGQKRATIVYRFISEGTLEENIQKLKMKKESLFRNVLDPLMGHRGASDFFLKNLQALLQTPKELDER